VRPAKQKWDRLPAMNHEDRQRQATKKDACRPLSRTANKGRPMIYPSLIYISMTNQIFKGWAPWIPRLYIFYNPETAHSPNSQIITKKVQGALQCTFTILLIRN
jgi:hypothetical protein